MAFADDLLAQARHLARREAKRPRQASLRRAVSTAYYSLFHLLVEAGSRTMAPTRPRALRGQVRRAFVHSDMKAVCKQFEHGNIANLPARIRVLIHNPLEAQFAIFAAAFVELQDARHTADYDLSVPFTRFEVLEKIDLAEQAFQAWHAVRDTPNANVFLAALLLNRQWGRAGSGDNA